MIATELIDDGERLLASAHGAHACFTSRAGGVSAEPFDTLNLSPWAGDRTAAVEENRRRAEALASVDRPRRLVIGRQVHETAVAIHLEGLADPDVHGVDGHVTDRTDLALGVLTADCLPVLFLAPWGVAAAHAGWRGLAGGVVGQVSDDLMQLPGGDGTLDGVVALIGPSAGPCCYEVGEEVHAAFEGWPVPAGNGRTIDLPGLAQAALEAAGVTEVVTAGRCTICDPRYFSHRAGAGRTGRQAGMVWRG